MASRIDNSRRALSDGKSELTLSMMPAIVRGQTEPPRSFAAECQDLLAGIPGRLKVAV